MISWPWATVDECGSVVAGRAIHGTACLARSIVMQFEGT